jgi:hypothetical protein
MSHFLTRTLFAGSLAVLLVMPMSEPQLFRRAEHKTIYWGALIHGDTYGHQNAPWDQNAIDRFEESAGKPISILHWGQAWWTCDATCHYQEFFRQRRQYEAMRRRGIIPMVDWAAWNSAVQPQADQPDFALQKIIDGKHDKYIRRWAREAAKWGHPFFLRFNWEMNGNWFPWGESANGNSRGQYVAAWRHVHDIFREEGADNVTWVWCPNVVDAGSSVELEQFYPGDEYVDWMCMDGYNWGEHEAKADRWKSFTEVFSQTYAQLIAINDSKPIMIGETASTEVGGSKAEWIGEMLKVELPQRFPRVEAVLWFNWNTDGMDWVIESSGSAQEAFARSIASPYYSSEGFGEISTSPIPPLHDR